METKLDLSRWNEPPRGVLYRRWVIVSHGLSQVWRTRFFRLLLLVAWAAGVVLAAAGFLFSQSVTTGGWLETFAATFGPRVQAVASAFAALILLYPDICIGGVYTALFWLQSFVGLGLSLIVLTTLVPGLVTRDQSTHALTIYLSRPLTSLDYLAGKIGVILGVLLGVWTGPLLAGWLLSLLLSPNRDFVVYSFAPLLRALSFNAIGLVVLAPVAMGVSALTRSARATTVIWIGVWLIAGSLASGPHAPTWLRLASFSHGLGEIRKSVFDLDGALLRASSQIPLLNQSITNSLNRAARASQPRDLPTSAAGLAGLVLLSSTLFLRKLRAE